MEESCNSHARMDLIWKDRDMELMTYMENQDAWVAFPSALQGLRLSRASSSGLLLFSGDPVREVAEMIAFIGLFRSAGGEVDRLGVASRYPSLYWIRSLREEGISRMYFVSGNPEPSPARLHRTDLIGVPEDLCPALHVRCFDGRPMCVCGNRFDLLALGRRQFSEQCFARWTACRWVRSAAGMKTAMSR
jgi:hypothetical protein